MHACMHAYIHLYTCDCSLDILNSHTENLSLPEWHEIFTQSLETSEHPWGSLLFPSFLFRLSFWKDLPTAGEDGATADAGEWCSDAHLWENDQLFEGLRSDCAVLIGWPLCEVGLTGFVLKWKLMYVQGKAGQMLWMLGLWLMMASWSCGIRDSFWPIPPVVPRQVQIDRMMMSTPWCLPHNLPRWIYLLELLIN